MGLNAATSPKALKAVASVPNLSVRYLTRRFHAKIYVFNDAALLGSSNLTDGGLRSNREATICLDQTDDLPSVEEIRTLFAELWQDGLTLTPEVLRTFTSAYEELVSRAPDVDLEIEKRVGRAEPRNVDVKSSERSRERIFLEDLRRQVYGEYRASFEEVTAVLDRYGLRREDLKNIGVANETNRFLNWVRLAHAPGDEAWKNAVLRSVVEREAEIRRFADEWVVTENSRVTPTHIEWLQNVRHVFGSEAALAAASQDDLTNGMMSLHAFHEQSRFTKGGEANLPTAFWRGNNGDVERVKRGLTEFIFGRDGDFIQRLHDLLYDPEAKLRHFGRFCALELYGTLRSDECPPVNGRMAKALRYLGYDVRAV